DEAADRLLRLLERLLVGRRDLRDLEDVPAELRLHRAAELAALGGEERLVELLFLLALRDAGELAALVLRRLVDREVLRDGAEGLAARQPAARLVGLRLRARHDDGGVTALGLGEALLVLLVVLLDVLVGDLVGALEHLLADLVRDEVEAD